MFKKYIFILLLLVTSIVKAENIEVNNLDKIKQDFEENYIKNYLPQDLLMVIDLDKILFKPLLSLGEQIDKDVYAKLAPTLQKMSKNPKNIYIDQLILTSGKYKKELLDSNFPNFVSDISNKNIPIIAVNGGFTGNFNNIPKFEIWIADYLKKNFNIDFSNSFPKNNYIIFNNLESFSNTYPVFYKGILTSNNISGAELMINFCVQMNFMPKVLIMVSGSTELLSSMEAQLANYSSSVVFIGYYYNNQDSRDNNANYNVIINDLTNQMNNITRNNPPLKTNNAKSNNPYDQSK
ncbi:DUF2608 domain-containing protein [Rickettsia endosymbiont of Urophora cardui]|uniref:DUF2608 domain-containing protein n=1 Tax=Rickettsia endosymbiont of Urophora cardui TaxID=3066265 RepID=UPI00313C633E